MKSIAVRLSAVLIMLGAFAVVSFGQKNERVKFAAGKTDGSFTRTIPAQGSIDFIINAKAGQYMDYTPAYDLKKTDIQAFLTEPNLQDVSQTPKIDERNVFKINTSGDHHLTVNNMTRKSVTFTLYLQITDTDPDVDDGAMSTGGAGGETAQDGRERIKFAQGASSATLERVVSGDAGTITFILYAKKGQIINFTVDGNSELGISLSDAGSQDAILQSEPGEPNEYQVVKSGDHFITVVNRSNRKANFTLRVVIN